MGVAQKIFWGVIYEQPLKTVQNFWSDEQNLTIFSSQKRITEREAVDSDAQKRIQDLGGVLIFSDICSS